MAGKNRGEKKNKTEENREESIKNTKEIDLFFHSFKY